MKVKIKRINEYKENKDEIDISEYEIINGIKKVKIEDIRDNEIEVMMIIQINKEYEYIVMKIIGVNENEDKKITIKKGEVEVKYWSIWKKGNGDKIIEKLKTIDKWVILDKVIKETSKKIKWNII